MAMLADDARLTVDVPALIAQLSFPSRKTRMEAEQALMGMGESVLAYFKETEHLPVAARESISRIKLKLHAEAIQTKLQASHVSYPDGRSFSEIIELISVQTNNEVLLSPSSLGKLTVPMKAEQAPFWEMIDDLSKTAKIGWIWDSQQRLVLTSEAVRLPGQHSVSNCVRLNVDAAQRRQNFNQTNLRRVQRLNCRLDVEPRIHLFYATIEDETFSFATQDTALKPFTPNSKRELTSSDNQTVEFPLDFIVDRDLPDGTLHLDGKVKLMTAGQRVPCRFPIKQSPSETISVGESEVMLELVQNSETDRVVCTLQVKLKLPPDTFTSHRLGMLHQSVWLETSSGRIRPSDMQIISMNNHTHKVRFTFETKNHLGGNLVYEVPHLISEQEFQFRVEDVSVSR